MAGLLVASGCAPVGPDFVRPDVPLQPEWLSAELEEFDTGEPELVDWWRQFEDPVLDQLIGLAFARNNSLRIAGLRVLEAQARLNVAVGNQYPQVQVLAGDVTSVGTSSNGADGESTERSFRQANLAANISWEIDFWGRFRRGVEAADASFLASVADYDDAMVLVTAGVAETYVIIRTLEEQVRLARTSYDTQKRSYEIAELLYRNGENSELDALQAETLLLGTEAVIPGLEIGLRQAKNALATLLGMAPGEVDALIGTRSSLPDVPDTIAAGSVPAELLRQRPDVRRAELNAFAQNAVVGIATTNLYPSFSLNGSLGLGSTDVDDSRLGDFLNGDSTTWVAGASFVWPFFNYGRIRNNIRVEDARLQQALIAYRETVLEASREVEDAMAAFAGSRRQAATLRQGVVAAQRSADLSLLRYQEGFADYQRVLNAQQSLFSQQQRYATAQGDILISLVDIYRSLGGGVPATRRFVDPETRDQMQERTNWGDLFEITPER
ncbi:MAG: efflux transporter outer membrane subunit [Woeseiaceae bacterium]|nr:efflux transporter outer membrane subunit [Woeseiaceae bacterium]